MTPVPESLQDLVAASLTTAGLHPSTNAETIAGIQRCEVAAFFRRNPTATVAEASEELVLSESSVERHLAALAGKPVPYRKFKPFVDGHPWKAMRKGLRWPIPVPDVRRSCTTRSHWRPDYVTVAARLPGR